jgi:predicted nuclease of predicted toxin-antitoxin system
VKLLLDANLSRRLPKILDRTFPGTTHVEDVGLGPDEGLIWEFAKAHGFMIVSKDADFYQLSVKLGAPPKTIYLRVWNGNTRAVAAVLMQRATDIALFDQDADAAVLILRL